MSNARTLANTINSSSQIVVPSGGVNFGTSTDGTGTVTGGILDDYEEGTWTPTVSGSSVGAGVYTKVGRLVFIECVITANSLSTTTISGLPFNLSTASGYGGIYFGRMGQCDVLDANGVPCRPICAGTSIEFRENALNGDDASFTITTNSSGTVRLGINGIARAI